MFGRSRWWGASFLWLAGALGCSQLPVPPYDAGVPADGPPPPTTFGPRQLTPIAVEAVALAADDSGIYWTSPANHLWVLPPEFPIPLPLVSDSAVATSCSGPVPSPPVLSASYAFWFGGGRATLHRTRKDGAGDAQVSAVDTADNLATDGSGVYWTESARSYVDGYTEGNVIRSLPQDAAGGAAPTTLLLSDDAISSMTVVDGIAYWTPYPKATVYYADIWSAPIEALARGGLGTKLAGPQNPYFLTASGSDVLFGFYPDRFTTGLARSRAAADAQMIATLPQAQYGFLAGLAAADDWMLATTYRSGYTCGQPSFQLYAVPFAGGTPKLVVTGMRTPAIAAPQGIVFVDASKHLVALPPRELATTVSPVP